MVRRTSSALAALVLVLCVVGAAHAAQLSVRARAAAPRQLAKLNRGELLKQLSKEVTLEGYFYDGSIPLIVDKMEVVAEDSAMPPDSYVPIVGPVPPSFKSGAKVRISGQVEKPTGEQLESEGLAIRVSQASAVAVLQAAPPSTSFQELPKLKASAQRMARQGKKCAVLIGGGADPANNHVRYWNDVVSTYQTMLWAGYSAANIRVVYAYGHPRTAGVPVHYPATVGGINAAFSYFATRMRGADTLYVLVSGQGAAPGQEGPTTAYWTWADVPMTPAAFRAAVNRVENYKRMVIQMNQSYSGGFILALMDPKRIIITAAQGDRHAYTHPSYYFGNFHYWYLSALRGAAMLGGAVTHADANNNGDVSISEAYNYALPRPGGASIPPIAAQRPTVEDTGAVPPRYGPLPGAGEGALSAATNL